MQHPILTGHDGGAGRHDQDAEAYRLVAEVCETALRTLWVSAECASDLRQAAAGARLAAGLPPQTLRLASG